MQSYAINPNKKTVIFYCEWKFNKSYYEMNLTEEQYLSLLDFHSNKMNKYIKLCLNCSKFHTSEEPCIFLTDFENETKI